MGLPAVARVGALALVNGLTKRGAAAGYILSVIAAKSSKLVVS